MNIDRRNRNYYNCGEFGHIAKNCRNKEIKDRIKKERRLKYSNKNNGQRRMIERGNRNDNLNKE